MYASDYHYRDRSMFVSPFVYAMLVYVLIVGKRSHRHMNNVVFVYPNQRRQKKTTRRMTKENTNQIRKPIKWIRKWMLIYELKINYPEAPNVQLNYAYVSQCVHLKHGNKTRPNDFTNTHQYARVRARARNFRLTNTNCWPVNSWSCVAHSSWQCRLLLLLFITTKNRCDLCYVRCSVVKTMQYDSSYFNGDSLSNVVFQQSIAQLHFSILSWSNVLPIN